ncbi:hypothetical protein ACIP98_37945 [Streptomyces sp. NPDC088354]|uniref:hypothetical protein n=1 Tax=unclassified Streptomyces TaxID=2593676 RepID=UPI0029A6C77A|nr:hypothetical protein [Streptomyces sp. MI02-7b]MDX3078348.1 hypothetical protein [Streptomyces sp. MI02-7b]
MINGLKRVAALGAATVALAASAIAGTVGTASAAPQDHRHRPPVASHHCVKAAGHWARQWHPAYRDRHHRWHPGQWTRVWRPAHQQCHR